MTIVAFALITLGLYLIVVTALRSLAGVSVEGKGGELKQVHLLTLMVTIYGPGVFGIALVLTGLIILLATRAI